MRARQEKYRSTSQIFSESGKSNKNKTQATRL